MNKFPSFRSTLGLDQVPASEQENLYWAAHHRLKREDENYRKSRNWYFVKVVALAVLAVVPGYLNSIPNSVGFLLSLIVVSFTVLLSFRELRLMNQAVGKKLQARLPRRERVSGECNSREAKRTRNANGD